jgi:hypothetical protein
MSLVRIISLKDKYSETTKSLAGYLPYDMKNKIGVWVSPKLGQDALYWANMMQNGTASFFCTDYVVVRGRSEEALYKNVAALLEKAPYLLHGLPVSDSQGNWVQIVVKWEEEVATLRNRQLFVE